MTIETISALCVTSAQNAPRLKALVSTALVGLGMSPHWSGRDGYVCCFHGATKAAAVRPFEPSITVVSEGVYLGSGEGGGIEVLNDLETFLMIQSRGPAPSITLWEPGLRRKIRPLLESYQLSFPHEREHDYLLIQEIFP